MLRQFKFPLQYLLGYVEFFGRKFETQLGVLIPRLETECLLEYAIKNLKNHASVLEIGIGSGIISITLFLERKDLSIQGVDINPLAIDLTKKNASHLIGEDSPLIFYQSHYFKHVTHSFDLIITNPPYISQHEYEHSDKELHYEPKDALITENEGLFFYETLAKEASLYLNDDGLLILEVSEYRVEKIISIFINKMFSFQDIIIDFLGHQRALVFKKI